MGIGNAVGKGVGSFYEPGSQGRTNAENLGGLADVGIGAYQYVTSNRRANEANQVNQQMVNNQIAMSEAQYADERAIRDRVLNRVSQLDGALQQTLDNLGARAGVSATDITQNYDQFRTQVMADYNKSLDSISSQGFASAIRRGMDSSTQMTDERRSLAEAAAENIPKLHQAAYDAAIARSTQYANAINSGRADTINEIGSVYNPAITAESNLATNNAYANYNTAASNQSTIASNANNAASDSQTYLGDAVGRFSETNAPSIGFGFGINGTVDPNITRIQELENQLAVLNKGK